MSTGDSPGQPAAEQLPPSVEVRTVLKALAQLHKIQQETQQRVEENEAATQAELRDLRAALTEVRREIRALQHGATAPAQPPVVIEGDAFSAQNPEVGLLEYLVAFLPDAVAIDVGANVGNFARRLLARGCSVWAFEPYGPSFEQLQRLGPDEKFHAFPCAIGAEDGTMDLHIAADLSGTGKFDTSLFHSLLPHPLLDDLQFGQKIAVPVRSLGSLWRKGEIPRASGLLKIDAEGFDLSVMRGMDEAVFSVVMAEFWDAEHAFHGPAAGRVEDLAAEMHRQGYGYYLVVYHVDETATISYYCNRPETVPQSWGNVLFFREQALFARALRWCDEVLPPTFHR